MSSETLCPRCSAVVQPDWDECASCGYAGEDLEEAAAGYGPVPPGGGAPPSGKDVSAIQDPFDNLGTQGPKPPRVYDPDASDGDRWRIPTIALSIVAAFLVLVVLVDVFVLDRGDTRQAGPSLADLEGSAEVRPLDDGWFLVELTDASLRVEVPHDVLRTRETLGRLVDREVPALTYVHTEPGAAALVIVADLTPEEADRLDDDLDGGLGAIDALSLPLLATIDEHEETEVAGADGWEFRAHSTEGDPALGALTLRESTLTVVVLIAADATALDEDFDRLTASFEAI